MTDWRMERSRWFSVKDSGVGGSDVVDPMASCGFGGCVGRKERRWVLPKLPSVKIYCDSVSKSPGKGFSNPNNMWIIGQSCDPPSIDRRCLESGSQPCSTQDSAGHRGRIELLDMSYRMVLLLSVTM